MTSSGRDSPHIRLNSSQSNLLTNEDFDNRPIGPRPQPSSTSRSLLTQSKPSSGQLQSGTNKVYSGLPADSSDTLLFPPPRTRPRRFRDEESAPGTPTESLSRRTSLDSIGKSADAKLIGADPFSDSRSPSRAGSDDDNVNTMTVSEKYNIMPSAGLLLYPEDVEKDDWLHEPDPNDRGDRDCNFFNRRGVVNIGGLGLFVVGLLTLFIGYPVL